MAEGWGKVIVGTRLEKQVSSRFFITWTGLITKGLGPGDGVLTVRGKPAHKAANFLIQRFLLSKADSLLFMDSDCDCSEDIITQFRQYEPGWEYDMLQAFYTRRGWPPTPIWLRFDALGRMVETYVTDPDQIDDVAVAGTHCCIVRRRVFEAILGDEDPARFEWFSYKRHADDSDEVSLSEDARRLGFKVGATTAIRVGHLSEVSTGWETYQDYMKWTGRTALVYRYRDLAALVGRFLSEDPNLVVAKSMDGEGDSARRWRNLNPSTPEEVRGFYGDPLNSYLYNLIAWNCTPRYERIIEPLYQVRDSMCLVVGPGLGTEADVLLQGGNRVQAFELPGVLREFVDWRFQGRVGLLEFYPAWPVYDVAVAVDVLEHIHPAELDGTLAQIAAALKPGGLLVMHAEWDEHAECPQHFRENYDGVGCWLAENFERTGDYTWQKCGA